MEALTEYRYRLENIQKIFIQHKEYWHNELVSHKIAIERMTDEYLPGDPFLEIEQHRLSVARLMCRELDKLTDEIDEKDKEK